MRVSVRHSCPPAVSFRAGVVKSMFNATDAATGFSLDADLDLDWEWSVGAVVGPSGSGKTSIGRQLFGGIYEAEWPDGVPVIDVIAPGADVGVVTAALSSAGLGDVPAWLKPYGVLSNGERFRAGLARVLAEAPAEVVIDEFSSVVDRQIACVGAGAFAKAWRRTGGRAVLLSCHYDVLDWLEPDWVFDTSTCEYLPRGRLQHRRPTFDLEIRVGGWELWGLFKPHHYLDSGRMSFARCYVGFVDGEPVCHLGVSTRSYKALRLGTRVTVIEARACRLVVFPEWQGCGVGMRFLNEVCRLQLEGLGMQAGKRMTTVFHTSHPQLCAALRRSPLWEQVSRQTTGKLDSRLPTDRNRGGRYGGHARTVLGFRYYGAPK
jgi:energy-coupling factor transporter ATP-binding protein EcfA2